MRVADVDRPDHLGWARHQPHQPVDQIVDIAEGARLAAVAIDGDRLVEQRLYDEVRHHAPVLAVHARTIGVEDARHLDRHAGLAVIVEEQRLGGALALVVAGARADRVDVAPIFLGLRMRGRVAIDLAGRGLQDLASQPLGEAEHVDRAVHRGLQRLDRVVLVVDRRGRTGEVVDLVDLDIEREADVVAQELEARIGVQMVDVALGRRKQIVGADDLMALLEQPVDQMRAEEAGSARHKDALAAVGYGRQNSSPSYAPAESRHRFRKARYAETISYSILLIRWTRAL